MECSYCIKRKDNTISGKEFNLKPTAGFENDRRYSSWIMKNKGDKKAGILIATNNSNAVYFDIEFCPMCGRKLGE